MRFSIKLPKKAKVKLQKVGGLLKALMDLIGDLLAVEGQVDSEVRVDLVDQEALVTGALLVEDQELLVVPICHLGEHQVDQMLDHLEVHLVGHQEDHLEDQWEDHLEGRLEGRLEDLAQEECHHGVHLEVLEDRLEQEVLEGHQVACHLHGWLDLEDHRGDPLECLLGEWLPRQELVMPPSLASGLNTQLQMERGTKIKDIYCCRKCFLFYL